ncbi:papain family cysteine protease domain-containing protein [Ditylenchus destructor]|uniref:Papain family cysteine protease domain-containing protein n=1 Tax=Ditylenchus destructor TaxID=166010 RepID=A0AAD4QRZ6_9BILA|nr:papain family cysteine protease domain-containing protein [Ditylenchus destructor]
MTSDAADIVVFCLLLFTPNMALASHLMQNLSLIHNFFANGQDYAVNNRYPTSPATSSPVIKTDSIPTVQVSWERIDLQNASDYVQELLDGGTGKSDKPTVTVTMPIEIPPLKNPMPWEEFRAMFPCMFTNSNCDESKLHSLITFNVFRSGVPFIQIDDNEPALKEALIKYGPLLVSVNASLTTFKNYKYIVDDADVYADPDCKGGSGLHAMILVGCGTHPLDGDFWILKNS